MALAFHYVTPTGATTKSGATWATAFDLAAFTAHWDTGGAGLGVAPGDVFVFLAGNYTLIQDIVTTVDGTTTDPIAIIGVKAATTNEGDAITASDFGVGTDRPQFLDGASGYGINIDDYSQIRNVILNTADILGLRADIGGIILNCKVTQSYTGATATYGVYLGGINGNVISNEVTGAECTNGIYAASNNHNVVFNYVHDITEAGSVAVFEGGGYGGAILFNVFDNVPKAIDKTAENGGIIFGNTFYDTDVGIASTTDYGYAIINNIFSDCATDAIIATTAGIKQAVLMYNHFYNNLDDYDGINADGDAEDLFCDFWDTAGDPLFTTAGSDFSLQAASPCIDAGMAMALGVG